MEMLVLSAVFAFSMAWRAQRVSRQSMMMVYSLRSHTAIVVAQGFNSVLLCDEGLLDEPSSIDYSLKGHWASAQWPMNPPCFTLDEDVRCPLVVKRDNLMSAQGKLLAIWNPNDDARSHKIAVDYLLVKGKQKPNLRKMLSVYQVGTLLIDGSVPKYRVQEWIQQAETHGIPYRNLHDGAVSL